jgi:hypothetical protein
VSFPLRNLAHGSLAVSNLCKERIGAKKSTCY